MQQEEYERGEKGPHGERIYLKCGNEKKKAIKKGIDEKGQWINGE